MPTMTMPLRRVIDHVGGRDNFVRLCLSDYPLFNEAHRSELNDKIINHYMVREIGYESVELFITGLKRILNENAPVFNSYYKSVSVEYDFLTTTDYVSDSKADGSSVSDSTSTSDATQNSSTKSDGESTAFEMPNAAIVRNGDYASSGGKSGSSTDVTGDSGTKTADNAKQNTASNAVTHVSGRTGDPSELVRSFRDAIVNVDMLVVDMVAPCFSLVWSTGDGMQQQSWLRYAGSMFGPMGVGGFYGW